MSKQRQALEYGLRLAKNYLDDGEHHPESRKYIVDVIETIEAALAEPEQEPEEWPEMPTMIVCRKCGNKRCPHANNTSKACTNSNALNQD